jgi:hypothetical protein
MDDAERRAIAEAGSRWSLRPCLLVLMRRCCQQISNDPQLPWLQSPASLY